MSVARLLRVNGIMQNLAHTKYPNVGYYYQNSGFSIPCPGFYFTKVKWKWLSHAWLFATPMDYTVYGNLQAKILEWVAFPFSRRSSQPRDQTQVRHIAGRFFTSWATREAQEYWSG